MEIASFGFWFVTAKLDTSWALDQLGRVLALVRTVKLEYSVIGQLSVLREERPLETLECVRVMIEGARQPWGIYSWKEQIGKILAVVLQSPDQRANRKAVELANRLGAMGHLDLARLPNGTPAK